MELKTLNALNRNVERLRVKMIRTAKEKGNLLDVHVIQVSQELDELLFQVQSQQIDKLNYSSLEREKIVV